MNHERVGFKQPYADIFPRLVKMAASDPQCNWMLRYLKSEIPPNDANDVTFENLATKTAFYKTLIGDFVNNHGLYQGEKAVGHISENHAHDYAHDCLVAALSGDTWSYISFNEI